MPSLKLTPKAPYAPSKAQPTTKMCCLASPRLPNKNLSKFSKISAALSLDSLTTRRRRTRSVDAALQMQYNRAQTATIAPLLLGMSGLGGAVVRRNKRRISDFTDIAHLADSQDGIQLTQRQRDLLKAAFSEADKKGKAGEWIMQRMLQDCPEVSNCLGASSTGCVEKSACYIDHCKMFSDVLDMAFESLDALDNSLGPLLVSYGSSHVIQSAGKGKDDRAFHTEYWDVFSDAMCDYGLSWKIRSNRVETIQAWRMLVFFMLTKMKQGYTLEMDRLGLKVDETPH